MLSIDYIRENKEKVAEAAKNKNREIDLDLLLTLDEQRRVLIQKAQVLREERNQIAKSNDPEKARSRGREIKVELKSVEADLKNVEEQYGDLMLHIPNVPLDEVPVGKDEEGNKEIKKWGEPKKFDFEIKNHIQLGEDLDLIDLKRGSKISGFRGYFLKNQLAQLQFAVLFYAFQKLAGKGYIPIIAPSIVKEFTLFGTGHFPWGRAEDVYKTGENDDAFLSGTAEIPVTAYHSGEVLNESDLPKRFVALSPCYRREAGAYGKDTKGIVRVHEFWKIEQVIIARNNLEEARVLHEELQTNTEEIMKDLELPYRVMMMCTGDMGEPQILKYDTDAWMPSEGTYREVASNSIMGDFQARRLNIRYRTKDGEIAYAYTLNDTAIASSRTLAILMENHQQKDGSITIPKALQSLVGFDTIEA